MTAHSEALLFLLQEAHATRYHPEGAAQRHIDAVTAEAERYDSYQTRPSRIKPDHVVVPPLSEQSEDDEVAIEKLAYELDIPFETARERYFARGAAGLNPAV